MFPLDAPSAEAILQHLSHDLRQALGTIEISAYLLDRSLGDDAPGREHIRTIERQVSVASELLHAAGVEMRRLRPQESRELTNVATAELT
jgi:hypothetical protein